MRTLKIIIIFFVLVAVGISGCLSGGDKPSADLSEPRENSEAGIKISVNYLPDITDATAFNIRVTAHSDYDDDFKKNSYLRDSSGKTYQALSYEGESGHHANGILRFPVIKSNGFELIIRNVAGVEERVFKW